MGIPKLVILSVPATTQWPSLRLRVISRNKAAFRAKCVKLTEAIDHIVSDKNVAHGVYSLGNCLWGGRALPLR